MPILLKILGIKAIGTVISIVIFITKSGPSLTTPDILIYEDSVRVETTLKKAFSKGLDEIIKSGSEVGIFYNIELLEKDEQGLARLLFEKTIRQYIVFQPSTNEYIISLLDDSELSINDLDSAKVLLSKIGINMIVVDRIKVECDYQVRLTAALNTIEIEAIDAKHFDLNAFWNFKYPMKNTKWIPGKEIAP
ncbi:hypothetical protein A2Y85_03075 [candidate division WOR-3 bacterium RBG_13_43_14]|uniref:DUF4390 domain-containing protein n=1 Tax=candidate division WOR-3 bacterium RBG_13_43_14 TaxID=1802590 RepID=A0A1F4UDI9_UNCW3|nr:MAG: hypothetical protein A2Y85_03075 [candidate division WOR-3 bacterium RBG_13_43_14]